MLGLLVLSSSSTFSLTFLTVDVMAGSVFACFLASVKVYEMLTFSPVF